MPRDEKELVYDSPFRARTHARTHGRRRGVWEIESQREREAEENGSPHEIDGSQLK